MYMYIINKGGCERQGGKERHHEYLYNTVHATGAWYHLPMSLSFSAWKWWWDSAAGAIRNSNFTVRLILYERGNYAFGETTTSKSVRSLIQRYTENDRACPDWLWDWDEPRLHIKFNQAKQRMLTHLCVNLFPVAHHYPTANDIITKTGICKWRKVGWGWDNTWSSLLHLEGHKGYGLAEVSAFILFQTLDIHRQNRSMHLWCVHHKGRVKAYR